MPPTECIYQVSNWYLKARWKKVRKTRTDGRTDGQTDGHCHSIIRPFFKRAYKKASIPMFSSMGNPIADIRWSLNHLISTLGDPVPGFHWQALKNFNYFQWYFNNNCKKKLNITNAKRKYAQGPISSIYLSLADVLVIQKFQIIIFKLWYRIVPWAVAAKLLSGECHRI